MTSFSVQAPEGETDAFAHRHFGGERAHARLSLAFGIAERHQGAQNVGLGCGCGSARRREGVAGELALELEDQTVGRFLADAWHAGEKRGVALLDGVCEILSAHA